MQKVNNENGKRVVVLGKEIKTLRFAGLIIIASESREDFKIHGMNSILNENFGINTNKTR